MTVRTLSELFYRASLEHDKVDAFRVRTGGGYHAVSHREALRVVEEIGIGLVRLGVTPGTRVAILSENRLEWALADYAILTVGAVNVPVYPTLPAEQVEFILRDSGASVVFVAPGTNLQKIDQIRSRLDPGLQVIAFEPAGWFPEPDEAEEPEQPLTVPASILAIILGRPARRVVKRPAGGRPSPPPPPGRRLERLRSSYKAPPPRQGLIHWGDLRLTGAEVLDKDPNAHRSLSDRVRETDPASIIYTSGTTGEPKGVILTHGNIVSNIVGSLSVLHITALDSCLSFLPLTHIFERMAGHFTMFHAGATIAYADSMETVPVNLTEVRPSILVSVPRLYEKLHARVLAKVAASPPVSRNLFHWAVGVGRTWSETVLAGRPVAGGLALRHRLATILVFRKIRERLGGRIRYMVSGGAPIAPELVYFFHGAGLPILEGYGLTETSPVVACNRLEAIRPGTVGQPIPGVEVRIAEDGEILVRGPGVMSGYFNRPAETAEALEGGWFHTGDVGHLDPDGYLSITDRKKDLIVTAGGKKVAPQPIENRLKQDPYISDAVLIGDGRPYVVALLVPEFTELSAWAKKEGLPEDPDVLCRNPRVVEFLTARALQVNSGLASFEQIKRFGLVSRMPSVANGDLTPTLKIRRKVFTGRYQDLIASLYTSHEPPVTAEPDTVGHSSAKPAS